MTEKRAEGDERGLPDKPPKIAGRIVHGEEPPDRLVFEYSGHDELAPSYVDGAFGELTPQGLLHVFLFAEYRKPETVARSVEVESTDDPNVKRLKAGDDPGPYRVDDDGNAKFVRHTQSHFYIAKDRLDALITWLQAKRKEMDP